MGVKSFAHELKVKVSASRMYKALVTEAHNVFPKATPSVKNVEIVEGHEIVPGCITKTNFAEGLPIKYAKNRMDVIDSVNLVGKFTMVEGDVLGDKFEKICYELKFVATEDGGCVIKITNEYHTKGDVEVSAEDINFAKEQSAALYKGIEEYLLAHPDVCV